MGLAAGVASAQATQSWWRLRLVLGVTLVSLQVESGADSFIAKLVGRQRTSEPESAAAHSSCGLGAMVVGVESVGNGLMFRLLMRDKKGMGLYICTYVYTRPLSSSQIPLMPMFCKI
ncbi:hypothetical protein EDB92DRAFT_1851498 [Lactarius akahatsu]|uniref:Uncharacterized protein n=1 Tax=Lactarius akahatsu TaxID=416441 RepID=A0AAD4LIB5_9AGAM|nr:hypothetical protein EDB92DRAFT_1851498 [Lactarius akahatsu]